VSLPPHPPQSPRPANPPTQELPRVEPAATGGATQVLTGPAPTAGPASTPTPVPPLPPLPAPQPTGPVDFVPGLPGVGSTAPARPVVKARRRNRSAIAGLGLLAVAVLLLEVGFLQTSGNLPSFWSSVPLWCGFATLAALAGLFAFVGQHPKGEQLRNDRAWKIAAAGLAGLAVFWVLVVLPVADTDRGFVLTAALGCLGAALWLAPGRKA
jgi:hypothetical protein